MTRELLTNGLETYLDAAAKAPKRKFRNVPTEVDGETFASRKEAKRYGELKLLEKAGYIRDLQLHPKFPLKVNGLLVCTYIADFAYQRRDLKPGHPANVVEDVKSAITRKHPVYRIKNKLFAACYGLEITEV
jgi:hypothetical protein